MAKKQYALLQKRGFPGTLLGGGARGLHHFTEMVGGKAHITLNWPGTALVLEENPPKIENLFDKPVPETIIHELCSKLPTFARAYAENGLKPNEFHDFGPVVRFRTQFMNGWNELLKTIRERRTMITPVNNRNDQSPKGEMPKVSINRGFCRVGENPPVEIKPGIFRSTLVYNTVNMLCHFHEKAGARIDLHTHYAVQSGFLPAVKAKIASCDINRHF